MLEAELEAQLEQAEKQVSEVSGSKVRIEQELTTAKVRFVLVSSSAVNVFVVATHVICSWTGEKGCC